MMEESFLPMSRELPLNRFPKLISSVENHAAKQIGCDFRITTKYNKYVSPHYLNI